MRKQAPESSAVGCHSRPSSVLLFGGIAGGPGGSSIYGLYGEMGYFTVAENGTSVNHFSWNRVANMLYATRPLIPAPARAHAR